MRKKHKLLPKTWNFVQKNEKKSFNCTKICIFAF